MNYVLLILACAAPCLAQDSSGVSGDPRDVTEPVFPPVCSILSANQTSSSLIETAPDTQRVQAALDACAPGQAVRFSASGSSDAFLISPVTLPPGVTMQIDPEVTVFGSVTYADYRCDTKTNWCLPLIDVTPNSSEPGSAIMGYGVIDGRGGQNLIGQSGTWWDQSARPRLVFLGDNSTLAGADFFTLYKITLRNSPKFHLSGIGSNLTVWGAKITAPPDSPNTDGIDPSASSNITITASYISAGDDMIALKAGNGHVSNVTISHLRTYSGHGISFGSETNAGADNVLVTDILMDNGFGGGSQNSLRIKSDSSRGGEIRNVLYDGICILHGGDTLVFDPYYSLQTGNLIPNFHDITVRNLHQLMHDSSRKSTFVGYSTGGIVNPLGITLDNVAFDGWTKNDFQAPRMIHNAQFTLGPGPVNFASQLQDLAANASNQITVADNINNGDPPYACSADDFVYLAGELIVGSTDVPAGQPLTLTAVLQNIVSPPRNGNVQYPQQNAPTGTISVLEADTVVGTATIGGRVAYITIPTASAGNHTYTAIYSGDANFAPLAFGLVTVTAR